MSDTIPDVSFSDNTEQRTPCVLVLDGSSSMRRGGAIHQLNAGLEVLERELKSDPVALTRVHLLIIVAGGRGEATIVTDWCDAIDFVAPEISANGNTPLGAAMNLALDRIEQRKAKMDSVGVSSTRPWIFLISDGEPNDSDWQAVAEQCRKTEENRKVAIFPIGTKGANLEALSSFSTKPAKKLDGLKFSELFEWLSRSVSAASVTTPGTNVQMPASDPWEDNG